MSPDVEATIRRSDSHECLMLVRPANFFSAVSWIALGTGSVVAKAILQQASAPALSSTQHSTRPRCHRPLDQRCQRLPSYCGSLARPLDPTGLPLNETCRYFLFYFKNGRRIIPSGGEQTADLPYAKYFLRSRADRSLPSSRAGAGGTSPDLAARTTEQTPFGTGTTIECNREFRRLRHVQPVEPPVHFVRR